MEHEDQESITQWQYNTFGATTVEAAYARFSSELYELVQKLDMFYMQPVHGDPKILEECADVMITFYRVVGLLGGDLQAEVDKKMKINRSRKWIVDSTGNGQHEV